MKAFLFFTVSFFSFQVFGQDTDPPLLHVSGQAEISVKPTLTIATLTIRTTNETYASAVEELTIRVDLLVDVLKKAKFPQEDMLTSNFSVDQTYAYVNGERKATGFNGLQTLKVKFEQDKEKLLKLLTAVTNSKADPEIAISFDLDDKSKANIKKDLMLKAVSDAQSKASLIAEQADYKLAGIKEIKYGLTSTGIQQINPTVFEMATRTDVQVNNFEVADLTLSDQVLMVFKIAPK